MNRVVTLLSALLISTVAIAQSSGFDAEMRKYGLVNIKDLDKTIIVDLKYSSEDNFVGEDMYGELEDAYFEREFADRVAHAQRILQSRHPEYTLLIYDAARPISVQRYMHQLVQGTEFEDFVADGTRGGRHNYGVAVDLTIVHKDGTPLDMGAEFDEFSDAAAVKGTPDTSDPKTRSVDVYEAYILSLVAQDVISVEAANNRILLIEVMHEAGLVPYRREWWHFEEIMSMSETRNRYQLLDF
ncbi:MAG: M15 family metallopeptidase [Alistipes sp.]|nr:M15 family metallopeptidase [Alistipes sp.]